MGFPMLFAAIRASGLAQWRIAQLIDRSESRLSRICRRGGASREERETLSRLLGVVDFLNAEPEPPNGGGAKAAA